MFFEKIGNLEIVLNSLRFEEFKKYNYKFDKWILGIEKWLGKRYHKWLITIEQGVYGPGMSWNFGLCPGMSWNFGSCPGMSWKLSKCPGTVLEICLG